MNPVHLLQNSIKQAALSSAQESSGQNSEVRLARALVTAIAGKGVFEILLDRQKVRISSREQWLLGQEIDVEIRQKDGKREISIPSVNQHPKKNHTNPGIPLPQSARQKLIRQTLPHQRPLLPALKSLQESSIKSPHTNDPVSARTASLINSLISKMNKPGELTQASVLKQAFQQSGLFSEAVLGQKKNSEQLLNNDLKVQLQRILSTLPIDTSHHSNHQGHDLSAVSNTLKQVIKDNLKPLNSNNEQKTPSIYPASDAEQIVKTDASSRKRDTAQILQQVFRDNRDTAQTEDQNTSLSRDLKTLLHRIQWNQQQSISVDPNYSTWHTDIPVFNNDTVELISIDIEHRKQQQEHDQTWNIQLELNLETLGILQANLTMQGSQLTVSLWAENAMTQKLLALYQHELLALLEKTGLDCDHIQCCQHPVRKTETRNIIDSLVDHFL